MRIINLQIKYSFLSAGVQKEKLLEGEIYQWSFLNFFTGARFRWTASSGGLKVNFRKKTGCKVSRS
jgi:hypothetical protein